MPITYNTIATLWTNVINDHSIAMSRKKTVFGAMVYGAILEGEQFDGNAPRFANVNQDFTGSKFQLNLMKPFDLLTRKTTKATRKAARVPNTDDFLVKAEWDMTYFPVDTDLDRVEVKKMLQNAKQGRWDLVKEAAMRMVLSVERTIATAFVSGTTTETWDLVEGGLRYALRDDNTYGTVDRSDVSATDFAGNYLDLSVAHSSALSLSVLRSMHTQASIYGNNANLVIAGAGVYQILADLVEAAAAYAGGYAIVKDNTLECSAQYFGYAGMTMTLEPAMADATLVGVTPDPEEFDIRADLPDPEMATFSRNQGTVATDLYQDDLSLSLVVKRPRRHFLIEEVDAAA